MAVLEVCNGDDQKDEVKPLVVKAALLPLQANKMFSLILLNHIMI
jgi:hypothetical protein